MNFLIKVKLFVLESWFTKNFFSEQFDELSYGHSLFVDSPYPKFTLFYSYDDIDGYLKGEFANFFYWPI